MTLEEAIIHAESVANSKCDKCGEEHRQLAEWLKDYQRLLSVIEDIKAEITEHHDIHLGQLKSRSNAGILMFGSEAYDRGIKHAIEILDNIGKAESEE